MNTYLVKDINKQYTNVISKYLKNGYTIHTNTMGGSQGEKAGVHLIAPDMKTVLRITLDQFHNYRMYEDGYEINVREYPTSKLRQMNELDSMNDILWESEGKIIDNTKFYQISNYKRNFYGDKDAFDNAKKKHAERRHNRSTIYNDTIESKDITSKNVIKVIMPWVKRQYKCTSMLPRDIEKVMKCTRYHYDNNKQLVCKNYYEIDCRNNKTLYFGDRT